MMNRSSGILMHITSLPSKYGIGDMGKSAYDFVDLLDRTKQTYWQILPLNPTSPANGNSPYFSCSAFAGNPFLVSPVKLYEDGLISEDDLSDAEIPANKHIDFDKVSVKKNDLLEKAYKNFKKQTDISEFQSFCVSNASWLNDFAVFAAVKEMHNGDPWDKWRDDLKDHTPQTVAGISEKLADKIRKEKFMQFMFFKQWMQLKDYANKKHIKIIGDVPIYVSYDSVDVWANSQIFKLDKEKKPVFVSGVPPDYFSSTGQLWNNPVYNWDVLKSTGYKWWIDRFAETFRKFDLVRIDHFRGLVQYWEVPAGSPNAIKGTWQDVPTYDFFDTIMKQFQGFPVIAEDLGIITDDVKEAMKHYGFPGMKVLIFAFGNDDPKKQPYLPHNYERNNLVYTGTHDNNTLIGWISSEASRDEKDRLHRYLGRDGYVDKINWEVIRLAMMSVADVAIIPLQDVIGLDADSRMNQPSYAFGNWKWQLVDGLLEQWQIDRLLEMTLTYGRDRRAPEKKRKSATQEAGK